ncbi:MAG TPA: BTAD domain-containing putative transcriptional regulator [Longimicrobiaceae bacterium]|nr:BTAD domain-containing putative transcriptional regulator [Longimicrobiaceae bacterium]
MLSLRLFGGLQAHVDDQPLAGRAAHRKRLALLALLGTVPSRTMSRDKLVALLWPEHDAERGRHQLATALYDVRKAGGEELVLTPGDDLRLNAERVACDVWEFEALLSGGEPETAVRCYAGPLLDGFFLSDAPEFERWIDGERDRLARLYARTLEALAAEAEAGDDFVAAAQRWQQLAAQDPYSSRVALRLMSALAAAGDPAAAIRHAGIHEVLVREELGAEPSAEIAALADRLRAGEVPPARAAVPLEAAAPAEAEPVGSSSAPARASVPDAPAAWVDGAPARPGDATPRPHGRGRRWGWMAGALGAGAVVLAASLSPLPVGGRPPAEEEHPAPMIAVLPLKNDTGDPGQEHFADAMTEALIAELAREDGLRVISRTSVMPYKDPGSRKLPEIARELNADLIVEGSVFRDGDRVRITAQLIRASSDEHVWAESHQGDIRDIFALQGRVARAVAGQIGVRSTARSGDLRGGAAGPVGTAAYESYLRGRQTGGSRSIQALQQAIALDPEFAPAYATLADRLALAGFFAALPPDSAFGGARRAALQALARDERSAEAHGALGIVLLHHDWNWTEAEKHFRRALALNPSNAYLRHMYAHQLLARGRTEESARESARAAELDPFNAAMIACSGWHGLADGQSGHAATESLRALRIQPESFWPELILGWAYEQEGKYPEAIAAFKDAVSHSGGSSFALAAQAHAHAVAGEEPMARTILAELLRRSRTGYVSAYDLAAVYAGLRDDEEALRWLERAFAERSSFLVNLGWEPRFRRLHADPRFRSLARRIGVPVQQDRT